MYRSIVGSQTGNLVLCYLQHDTTNPTILFTSTVYPNLTYNIKAFNHQNISLPKKCNIANADQLVDLLQYIKRLHICPGNNDSRYLQLAENREGKFEDRNGKRLLLLYIACVN